MKKTYLLILTVLSLSLNSYNQTTYTWTGLSGDRYEDPTNWSPNSVPGENDYILFNTTCFVAICDSFVVSKLTINNNSSIYFHDACAKAGHAITLKNGTSAVDMSIQSGSSFTLSGVMMYLQPNAKGEVYGNMSIEYFGQFISNTVNGLTFKSGSFFMNNNDIPPFGTTATPVNTVLFENGSVYEQYSGSSPFGISAPASKVTFQPTSNFRLTTTLYSDFVGRTFGNLYNEVPINLTLNGYNSSNNDFVVTDFTSDENFTLDLSGNSPNSNFIFHGNININSIYNLFLNTDGIGGYIFDDLINDTTNIGPPGAIGNITFQVNTNPTPETGPTMIPNAKTVLLERNINLNSVNAPFNPIRFYVEGTIDCDTSQITGMGWLQLGDNSTFKTKHTGGVTAACNSLVNSGNLANPEPYLYTNLTTFIYNGIIAQNTGLATNDPTFGTIIINNPAGVDLDNFITVKTNLVLQNGDFRLNNGNISFFQFATYDLINGQIVGNQFSSMNVLYNSDFILPPNLTLGTLGLVNAYNVLINGSLTVHTNLNIGFGSLNINSGNLNYYGPLNYPYSSNLTGSPDSQLELSGIQLGNDTLRAIELGTLIYNKPGGILVFNDSIDSSNQQNEIIINNNFDIISGNVFIDKELLTLGGTLNINIASGNLFSNMYSSLNILNNASDIILNLAELKSLNINRNAIINIKNNLTVYEDFISTNADVVVDDVNDFNSSLTLNGLIQQSNSLLISNGYGGSIYIRGNYAGDCTMMFDPTSNFNDFVIDRINGRIHLGSELRVSFLQLDNGLLFLENFDLNCYPFSNIFTTNSFGFDNTRYIVTNGTGSVIMRNGIAKNTIGFNFPVGNINGYTPVNVFTDQADDIFYDFTVHCSENIPAVSNPDSWVQNSWNVNVNPQVDYDLTLSWQIDSEGPTFDNTNCYISEFNGTEWDYQIPENAFFDSQTNLYSLTKTAIPNNGTFAVKAKIPSECPDSVYATPDQICINQGDLIDVTLSFDGGIQELGDTFNWYDESLAINYGEGNNLLVADLSQTTIFYLGIYDGTDINLCEDIEVIINEYSVQPDYVNTSPSQICTGDSTSEIWLDYMGGYLAPDATATWYSDEALTQIVSTEGFTSITPPTETTTYYLVFEGICNETTPISSIVNVNQTSTNPIVENINFCGENITEFTLEYIGGFLAPDAIAVWYADEALATPLDTGNYITVSDYLLPYTFYVQFQGICNYTDSIPLTIQSFTPPTATITCDDSDLIVCNGDSITFTGSGGIYYDFYIDTNLVQSDVINQFDIEDFTDNFTFSVIVTDINSCTDSSSIYLDVYEYSLEPDVNDIFFCEQSVSDINLSYYNGYLASDAIAIWYEDSELTNVIGSGNNFNIIAPTTNQTYYLQLSGYCNSTPVHPINITVNPKPQASVICSDPDLNICPNDTINFTGSGGTIYDFYLNEIYYQCDDSCLEINEFNEDFNLKLIVIDNNSCSDTTSLDITVNETPAIVLEEQITVNLGESIILNSEGNQNYNYFWTPFKWMNNQNIYNPVVTPNDTITYAVTVTNSQGCKSFYKIKLDLDVAIKVYDAISPNNDGKNDYWVVQNIERFEGSKVEIFDRNGNSIFKTENYQNNFDGKNQKNGEILPFGTYFYIIDLNNGSNNYKGTFMIFR